MSENEQQNYPTNTTIIKSQGDVAVQYRHNSFMTSFYIQAGNKSIEVGGDVVYDLVDTLQATFSMMNAG